MTEADKDGAVLGDLVGAVGAEIAAKVDAEDGQALQPEERKGDDIGNEGEKDEAEGGENAVEMLVEKMEKEQAELRVDAENEEEREVDAKERDGEAEEKSEQEREGETKGESGSAKVSGRESEKEKGGSEKAGSDVEKASHHSGSEQAVEKESHHSGSERDVEKASHHSASEGAVEKASHHSGSEQAVEQASHHSGSERNGDEASHHSESERDVEKASHHSASEGKGDKASHHSESERNGDEASHHSGSERNSENASHHSESEHAVEKASHHSESEGAVEKAQGSDSGSEKQDKVASDHSNKSKQSSVSSRKSSRKSEKRRESGAAEKKDVAANTSDNEKPVRPPSDVNYARTADASIAQSAAAPQVKMARTAEIPRTPRRKQRKLSLDQPRRPTTGKRRRKEIRKHDDEIVEYSYSYSYSESDPETEHAVRPPGGSRKNSAANTARLHQLQVAEKMKNMSEEMKQLRIRAIKLEPIDGYPESVYEELREILVEERRQQASKNKLEESEELTAAINHIDETETWQKKMNLQAEAYQDYQQQAKQLQDRTDAFDVETKTVMEQLKNKLKAQRQRILENQERELEMHSKRWTSDAKTRQYSHATNRLVFLRKQFKLLMTQCRFREANEVKAIIERTERAEQDAAFKCLQHDFDQSLAKLQQKHREELIFFEEQAKIKIIQLEQQRARLRVAYLNKKKRMDQLEKKVSDADKVWNMHQLERTEELSNGTLRSSVGVRTTKLSLSDIRAKSDKDENLITLPPLNTRRNARTVR